MKSVWMFLVLSVLTHTYAHGEMTRILGEGLNLAYKDHALAGSVGEQIVMGHWGGVMSTLSVRSSSGEFQQFSPKLINGKAGIEVQLAGNEKILYQLDRIDSAANKIHVLINGESSVFSIQADSKNGSHFVNPTVSGIVRNKEFKFQIENGEACFGCLSQIVYMILIPYLINEALEN